MLKKTWILFLGLVVCIGSACVTPTHASSASNVIIVQIQAASPTGAKDEMVTLYNNSNVSVDISNWCLTNKSNIEFACITPYRSSVAYYLPAYSYIIIASESFANSGLVHAEDIPIIYTVTNQSSGSIVNSSDKISILDSSKQVVDSYSWSAPIPTGKIASRNKSLTVQNTYEISNPLTNWSYEPFSELKVSIFEIISISDNPDLENPDTEPETPIDPPLNTNLHLRIVEILPNPVGSDVGSEFIEIYNPNDISILLDVYRLRVGSQLEKSYKFPVGASIAAGEYKAFTNQEIKFTLLNSSSSVQLERNGILIDDTVLYESPPEGFSYAEYNGSWYYTAVTTPGAENNITSISDESQDDSDSTKKESSESTLKPCAANQYRHPETNRCRNNATTTASTVTPCRSDQYRSPETNRCRNISSSATGPSPCKEGQERNPDTNRCRSIVNMTNAGHSIKGVAVESSAEGASWYWWFAIGGIVLLVIGYAIWEWRVELMKLVHLVQAKFARNPK